MAYGPLTLSCVIQLATVFISFWLSLQADPPDITKIPVQDATGVTVVLLTCGYRTQEFIRVGYYVNNEYADPELKENPPANPDFNQVGIVTKITIALKCNKKANPLSPKVFC